MTVELNPFHPPQSLDNSNKVNTDFVPYVQWPLVFALNMTVPAAFGWYSSEFAGRQGIVLASFILLLFGWGICLIKPKAGRLLNIGSLAVGATQLVPVIQIVIGAIGIKIVDRLGGIMFFEGDMDGQPFIPRLSTEWGGFVVTFFVGGTLIACAGLIALLVGLYRHKSTVKTEQAQALPPVSY